MSPLNQEEELSSDELTKCFAGIAAGDASAYERVFNVYYDRIYQLAFVYSKNEETAEDTAQHIFMKVWERRHDLQHISNPEGWLFRGAKHEVWKMLERDETRARYRKYIQQQPDDQLADTTAEKERELIIQNAINKLPPQQQLVYRLGREEGLTYAKIAEELDISRESVKEYMSIALKKLREYLSAHKDWLISLPLFFYKFFF